MIPYNKFWSTDDLYTFALYRIYSIRKVEEIVLMSLLLILWMAQTCLASGDCQRVGTKSSSYPLTSKLFSRRLHHLKGPQCKQYAKPFYFIHQLLQEHFFFQTGFKIFQFCRSFLDILDIHESLADEIFSVLKWRRPWWLFSKKIWIRK